LKALWIRDLEGEAGLIQVWVRVPGDWDQLRVRKPVKSTR
jgi:hypothetical protein